MNSKLIFATWILVVISAVMSEEGKSRQSENSFFLDKRTGNQFLNVRLPDEWGEEDKEGTLELIREQRPPSTPPPTNAPPTAAPAPTTPGVHPCANTKQNRTVITPHGKVICLVPTENELLDELKEIGGYNRHYVAVTEEEALKNFDDLIGNKQNKPWWKINGGTGISGRRRRYVHEDTRLEERFHFLDKRSRPYPNCPGLGQRMCAVCQVLTKLSASMFPRHINELICDTALSGDGMLCYPGLGRCNQGKLNVDLLTNSNDQYTKVSSSGSITIYKQVWQPKVQEIRTCCECIRFAGGK